MAMQKKTQHSRRLGWIYLTCWALLIVAGIVAKRVYEHADWMVLFHLPAAVFLVMSFQKLSYEFRAKYRVSFRKQR